MKTKNKFLIIIAICLFCIAFMTTISNASSYLKLNEISFEAKINDDASMNVVEYWNIRIEDTNTLYKFFKTDSSKFSGITNVYVSEYKNGSYIPYTMQSNWQYHVPKNYYYGTKNDKGNFEIGWGVGLDNGEDTRKYKIEYVVKDAVSKNKDYAQLYWQFIGKEFEVPAKKVKGVITLPQSVANKEDIRVWGHAEGLNGTIYATANNKVEFNLDGRNEGTMVEVRVLFPTQLIESAGRTTNTEILQAVINEETKWAEEANLRRNLIKYGIMGIALLIGVVSFLVISKKINKYKARLSELELVQKIVPSMEMEYFRDIPRKNARPGEAYRMITESLTDIPSTSIGNIFSACLLDLSLQKCIEFIVDDSKKDKDKISIVVLDKEAGELGEEKEVLNFLKKVKQPGNPITVKELQKYIQGHTSGVETLVKNINKAVKNGIYDNKLIDKKGEEEYNAYSESIVLYSTYAIALMFALGFIIAHFSYFTIAVWGITMLMTLYGMFMARKIKKKINVYTQSGVDEIQEWKGLKKFMLEYSSLNEKETVEVVLWEKFLVFATAFGVADKVIKQLKLVYPNFEEMSQANNTALYMAMHYNLSNDFSNAISTSISSAYSSATGGGGGFSGGGGGGGGRRWRRRTLNYNYKILKDNFISYA